MQYSMRLYIKIKYNLEEKIFKDNSRQATRTLSNQGLRECLLMNKFIVSVGKSERLFYF